tara:strand:- start:712 stop:1788 length:1077 start_codon:yes stop_codon:yes gene_type:complete
MVKKKTRKRKIVELEPTWDKETNPTWIDLSKVKSWYNTNYNHKDMVAWVFDWAAANGYSKADLRSLKTKPVWNFTPGICTTCRMDANGWNIPEKSFIRIKEIIDKVLATSGDEPETEETKTVKVSPAARLKKKTNNILAEMDDVVDNWKDNKDYSFFNYLKKVEAARPTLSKVYKYYERLQDELKELVEEKTDDLVEVYAYLSKREQKAYLKFVDNLVSDVEKLLNIKKAGRKAGKVKVKTVDQILKFFNYCKENSEYKIASVNPTNIVGARRMFVFNPKYNQMRVFFSDDGFNIHRSAITGFNDKSYRKKLRNPGETISSIMKLTPKKAEIFMRELKTKSYECNGRINKDCIILRVE